MIRSWQLWNRGKKLIAIDPRDIEPAKPCGSQKILRLPVISSLLLTILLLLSFSRPPRGYPKTPETLHTLEHGYPVVEVDPYRNSNRSNRYSDNRIVAPLQLQLEQRGPPLLSRETTRL